MTGARLALLVALGPVLPACASGGLRAVEAPGGRVLARGFDDLRGIAVSAAGEVYAVDAGRGEVVVLGPHVESGGASAASTCAAPSASLPTARCW